MSEDLRVVGQGLPRPRLHNGNGTDEVAEVVAALAGIGIAPREMEWAHLSLCVLDATFSTDARYSPSLAVCTRYAELAGLEQPVLERGDGWSREAQEQSLDDYLAHAESMSDHDLAAKLLGERFLVSPEVHTLRAEAARRVARALVEYDIHTLADARAVLVDPRITARIDEALRKIPGGGQRELRASYFWMLVGDDERIKPDRWVLHFLAQVLGRSVTSEDARRLLKAASVAVGHTPWELDHAIWSHTRRL